MSGRSVYLAAWRKKTPTVVRSAIDSGSMAGVEVVTLKDVALLDRLDRESEGSGGHAHGDFVALFLADQRTPYGGIH